MEFYCVLSVDGSLASYQVEIIDEVTCKAVLKTTSGRRNDIPAEIVLHKQAGDWQAQPLHDEIVQGLIKAIETSGQWEK